MIQTLSAPNPSDALAIAALSSADSGGGGCSYLVGRDHEGHWLAVESHGLGGGIFLTEAAAIRHARFETDGRPGAVRCATEPLSLRM